MADEDNNNTEEVPEREGYVSVGDAADAYWKAHPDRPRKTIYATLQYRIKKGELPAERVQVGKRQLVYVKQEDIDNMKPLPPYTKRTRPDVTARNKKAAITLPADALDFLYNKRSKLDERLLTIADMVRSGVATVTNLIVDVRING